MDLGCPKLIRRPYCDGDLYVRKFDRISGLLEITSSSGTFFAFANENFVEAVPKTSDWITVYSATLTLDSYTSHSEAVPPLPISETSQLDHGEESSLMGNTASASPEERRSMSSTGGIRMQQLSDTESNLIKDFLGVSQFSRGKKICFSATTPRRAESPQTLQSILKTSSNAYASSVSDVSTSSTESKDQVQHSTPVLSALVPSKRKKVAKANEESTQKKLQWGFVQIREHKRAVGGNSAVTSYTQPDWMLGLSDIVVIRHFTPVDPDSKSKGKPQFEETWEELDMPTRMGFSPSLIPDTSEQEIFQIEDHVVRSAEFGLAAFGIARQKGSTPSPYPKPMSSPRGPKVKKGARSAISTPSLAANSGDLPGLDGFDLGQSALSSETNASEQHIPRVRRRTTTHGIMTVGTVDEYEEWRQKELENRMSMLSEKDRKKCTGESRQFSHKSYHNPLFDAILPKARAEMLARDIGDIYETSVIRRNLAQAEACEFIRNSRKNSGCSCQISKESDFKKDTLITVKQKALARGLSDEGTKAEIVARIIQHAHAVKICGHEPTVATSFVNGSVPVADSTMIPDTEPSEEAVETSDGVDANVIPDKVSMGPVPYGSQQPRERGPEAGHHFLLGSQLAYERALYLEREVDEEQYDYFYKTALNALNLIPVSSESSSEVIASTSASGSVLSGAHPSQSSSHHDVHSKGPQCICVVEGIGCHYETCKCRDADCKNRWKHHCTAYTYDLQGVKDFIGLIMRRAKEEGDFFFDETKMIEIHQALENTWEKRREAIARAAFEKAERERLETERIAREAEEKARKEEEERLAREEKERQERLAREEKERQERLAAEQAKKEEEERRNLREEELRLERENKMKEKSKVKNTESQPTQEDKATLAASEKGPGTTNFVDSYVDADMEGWTVVLTSTHASKEEIETEKKSKAKGENAGLSRKDLSKSKAKTEGQGNERQSLVAQSQPGREKPKKAKRGKISNVSDAAVESVEKTNAKAESIEVQMEKKLGSETNSDAPGNATEVVVGIAQPVLNSEAKGKDSKVEKKGIATASSTPIKGIQLVNSFPPLSQEEVVHVLGFEPLFKNIANFRFCEFPQDIFPPDLIRVVASMMRSQKPRYTVFDIASQIAQVVGDNNLRLFFRILKDEAESNRKKTGAGVIVNELPPTEQPQKNEEEIMKALDVKEKQLPLDVDSGKTTPRDPVSPRSGVKNAKSPKSSKSLKAKKEPDLPFESSVPLDSPEKPTRSILATSHNNRRDRPKRPRNTESQKQAVQVTQ